MTEGLELPEGVSRKIENCRVDLAGVQLGHHSATPGSTPTGGWTL